MAYRAEGLPIPASSKIELPTGTYYWQAVYSGDSEHEEALSICGTEVLQVVVPPAWVVSVGDSYIAGEGGRWAGNVRWNHVPLVGDVEKMDALGRTAYFDNAAGNAEMIPLCHRSKSAEVFFDHSTNGTLVHGLNMACSGSETISEGYVVGRNTFFKPGLDFVDARAGQALPQGAPCPLPVCQGQATALQDFAQNWLPRNTRNEKIKMIVVSIGGNDFGFANVVKACAKAYMSLRTCRNSVPVKSRFEEPALGNTRNRIKNGILNIGIAMDRAGYPRNQYTILVQDYPSPLPANANDFRYNEGGGRTLVGRCPIGNGDAAWANNTALTTIDDTVRAAAADVNLAQPANNQYTIRIMELRNAFNGRRLCERDPIDHVRTHWWDTSVDRVEWINQVRLFKWGADFMIQEDLHPNFWGQLALRNCLRKVYNNGNPQSAGCIVSPGGGFEQVPSWVPATEVRGGVEHPRRITFEPKMELVAP
jgi:hypothetical protein